MSLLRLVSAFTLLLFSGIAFSHGVLRIYDSVNQVSFSTMSGYKVRAKIDSAYKITSLTVSKNGKHFVVPSSSYQSIVGPSLSGIRLVEVAGLEPNRFELEIPSYSPSETGAATTICIHKLVFISGVFNPEKTIVGSPSLGEPGCVQ
jgi:hypothetical protein